MRADICVVALLLNLGCGEIGSTTPDGETDGPDDGDGEPGDGNVRCFAVDGNPQFGGSCWSENFGVYSRATPPCYLDDYLPNELGWLEVDTWYHPCAAGEPLPPNVRCLAVNGDPQMSATCWSENFGVDNPAHPACHLDDFLPNQYGWLEVDTWHYPCAAADPFPSNVRCFAPNGDPRMGETCFSENFGVYNDPAVPACYLDDYLVNQLGWVEIDTWTHPCADDEPHP